MAGGRAGQPMKDDLLVLLVDDEEGKFRTLQQTLHNLGIPTQRVHTCSEARAALREPRSHGSFSRRPLSPTAPGRMCSIWPACAVGPSPSSSCHALSISTSISRRWKAAPRTLSFRPSRLLTWPMSSAPPLRRPAQHSRDALVRKLRCGPKLAEPPQMT